MIEKPYQLQSDTLAIRTGRNGTLLAITIRSGQNRSSVLTTRPCAPLVIQNQHVFLTRF